MKPLSGWWKDARFKIGLRNIKTALSVGLCLLVFQTIGISDGIQAAITAIICMKSSLQNSIQTGVERTVGTVIGAILGILTLILMLETGIQWATILAIVNVVLIIYLCNIFKVQNSTIISLVVFLMILIGEKDQPPLIYGSMRLVETIFGIGIAYLINRFIDPHRILRKKRDPYIASEIRPFYPGDLPQVMSIWLSAHLRLYPQVEPLHWHEAYEGVRTGYKEEDTVYLYTENLKVVGYIAVKGGTTLDGPYVEGTKDRIKVGGLLLEHAQTLFPTLKTQIPMTNEKLEELFLRAGFIATEETHHEAWNMDLATLEWSRKSH
jgi:hypothetical protein